MFQTLEKVMGNLRKSVNKLIYETIKSITIGSIVSSGFSINSELLERALISNSSLSQFNRILLLSQKNRNYEKAPLHSYDFSKRNIRSLSSKIFVDRLYNRITHQFLIRRIADFAHFIQICHKTEFQQNSRHICLANHK